MVELVKKEFGLSITRQQVESHDPTKANGRGLAQKWVDMFNATRERFQNEISDIPIANKAYRLRVLDRMATRAEGMKNLALTAEIIEQAAKECGDAYTNKHKFEHSGPNGGAIQTITMSKEEYKSARQEMMEDDDC
ncbi:phage protein [Enterobacter hormaechei]|nr:phage protein [Enterobacter hormaechei]